MLIQAVAWVINNDLEYVPTKAEGNDHDSGGYFTMSAEAHKRLVDALAEASSESDERDTLEMQAALEAVSYE